MPKSPLWSNPEFIADCRSEKSKAEIMDYWGVSSGLVVDVRKEVRGPVDQARSREPGESDEITDNGDGTKQFNFIRHRPVTLEDARRLIRSTGDNPDAYNISIKTIAYGGDKSSNKISAWPKTGIALAETYPLAQMYEQLRRLSGYHRQPQPVRTSGRGTVIVLADWQIGKTGRRGGTPELLERLAAAREKVETELDRRNPDEILILDGGDGIEGFESGGNPMFTNDLSLPDQLDCYATELFKFVRLAAERAPLQVGAVPSNHAAWRHGKQNLGNPSEDFGLFTHRQIEKSINLVDLGHGAVRWHTPDEWDESLCVDFMGTPIGLVHGNQFGPGRAIDWWQAQAFGGQAITKADVLVSAHYHSFGAGVAGQNPFTSRERMWVAAPTLDSGSDWYRNIKGRDSLPGTLIFDVTEDGFDLGSLKVL
ncbi:hypothetical protein [Streptomyces sp. AC495_CC817]|uniref:hypothetical protein n=1 Tax=Streptomyces sp. AC495_CC817 TaxID=2823900 RepID=UPI001C26B502|nr:hypothetical protein [Streptomyces sp. AC495_CC817]